MFGWGERREEGTVIGETSLLIMFGWVDWREEGKVREETFPLSLFLCIGFDPTCFPGKNEGKGRE